MTVNGGDEIMRLARDRVEREAKARAETLKRAEVSPEDVEIARCVLRKLALVELDDLCVTPGFNLLPDGTVGSVNVDTPEWQFWRDAQDMVDDANHMETVLFRDAYRKRQIGLGKS